MEESKDAGGGDFYDRVYSAERPELFFKSTASRTVGTGGKVRIRGDAQWSVPEPELTLVVSPAGRIIGYTIGNDMSSRDIEGRESALSAAGQGLQRQLRAWPWDSRGRDAVASFDGRSCWRFCDKDASSLRAQ